MPSPSRNSNNPAEAEVQAYLDQVRKGLAGQDPQAQTLARSTNNPEAQRQGERAMAIRTRENLANVEEANREQIRADKAAAADAKKMERQQAKDAEAARARGVRAAVAVGAKTITDVETGKRTIATHPDGSPISEAGPIGEPFIRPTAEAAFSSIPGMGAIAQLSRPANKQTLDQTTEVAQRYRNDKFQETVQALPSKTDPKTGEIYAETKDEFGAPQKVTLGTDQEIVADKAQKAAFEQKRQELDLKKNEHDQARAAFSPRWDAVKKEYDSSKTLLNSLSNNYVREPNPKPGQPARWGSYGPDDNWQPIIMPERNDRFQKWQSDMKEARMRYDRAKAAHDPLSAQNEVLTQNERQIEQENLKLKEEEIRSRAGVSVSTTPGQPQSATSRKAASTAQQAAPDEDNGTSPFTSKLAEMDIETARIQRDLSTGAMTQEHADAKTKILAEIKGQTVAQAKAEAAAQLEAQGREIASRYIGTGIRAQELSGTKPGNYSGIKNEINEMGSFITGNESIPDLNAQIYRLSGRNLERAIEMAGKMGESPLYSDETASLVKRQLEGMKKAFDDAGIKPEDQPRMIEDAAKSQAWTEKDTDLVRSLSTGDLVINPGHVFGQKDAIAAEINASNADAKAKQSALTRLEKMRQKMGNKLFTDTVYSDAAFKVFAHQEYSAGNRDNVAILDKWAAQQRDRNWIFKSADAVTEGVKYGSVGIVKTLVGGAAGLGALVGADFVSKPLGQAASSMGSLIQSEQEAAKLRGMTGSYGIASDLTDTVTQMAPMILGGEIAAGMKGLGAAATRGMSVYGWAGAQGYESKLADAVSMAEAQKGAKLTANEISDVLGRTDTQVAAFLNGAQTAMLAAAMPKGAERMALGTKAASMTVSDFLRSGGMRAIKDGTLRKELKTMGKTIFADATDEALEEFSNQALDGMISVGALGNDLKLGDLLEESFKAGAMGGIVGGGMPQIMRGQTKADQHAEMILALQDQATSTPDVKMIATALATIDPQQKAPSQKEIETARQIVAPSQDAIKTIDKLRQDHAAAMKSKDYTLAAKIDNEINRTFTEEHARSARDTADAVLLTRELSELEDQAANEVWQATQELNAARASGDKQAVAQAEVVLDQVRQNAQNVPLARAGVKIGTGKGIGSLTDAELRSIGYKPGENGTIEPMSPKELADNGLTKPLIRRAADGTPVILDEAVNQIMRTSPLAANRIQLGEQAAMEAAQARFDASQQSPTTPQTNGQNPQGQPGQEAPQAPAQPASVKPNAPGGTGAVGGVQQSPTPPANPMGTAGTSVTPEQVASYAGSDAGIYEAARQANPSLPSIPEIVTAARAAGQPVSASMAKIADEAAPNSGTSNPSPANTGAPTDSLPDGQAAHSAGGAAQSLAIQQSFDAGEPVKIADAKAAGINPPANYAEVGEFYRAKEKAMERPIIPTALKEKAVELASRIKEEIESAMPNTKGRIRITDRSDIPVTGGVFANSDGTISIHQSDLGLIINDLGETKAREEITMMAVRHELRHVAQYEVIGKMHKKAQANGYKGDFDTFWKEFYGETIYNELMATPKSIEFFKAIYDAKPIDKKGYSSWDQIPNNANKAAEGVRMLMEIAADGTAEQRSQLSELLRENLRGRSALAEFLKDIIQQLKDLLGSITGEDSKLSDEVKRHIVEVSALYDQLTANQQETAEPEISEDMADSLHVVNEAIDATLAANPDIKASDDLRISLDDAASDLAAIMADMPAEERRAFVDAAIADWIDENAEKVRQAAQDAADAAAEQAAAGKSQPDAKARQKAARVAYQARIRSKARDILNSGNFSVLSSIFDKGSITPKPNAISLILKRRDEGKKLTEKEMALLRPHSEGGHWDGMPRKQDYPGGGNDVVVRAILDYIMAPQGKGQMPHEMASAIEQKGIGKASEMWEAVYRELESISRGKTLIDENAPDYEGDPDAIAKAEAERAAIPPSHEEIAASTAEEFGPDSAIAKKADLFANNLDRFDEQTEAFLRDAMLAEIGRIRALVPSAEAWQAQTSGWSDALKQVHKAISTNTPESLQKWVESLPVIENEEAPLFSSGPNGRPSIKTTDGGTLEAPGIVLFASTAYHGTPHKVDRFSLDKIGTGEGAQAYGWGLYFAGNKEVAQWYKDALTTQSRIISWEYDGRPLPDPSMSASPEEAQLSKALMMVERTTDNPHADAVANLEMAIKLNENHQVGKAFNPARRKALEMLKGMKPEKLKLYRSDSGNLYTVRLKPDDDELLDWDKPLSEQSEKVQKSLKAAFPNWWNERAKSKSPAYGQTAYIWASNAGRNPEDGSKSLASAGIRGIRYLDGNSRGKGQGSYNYVIFDENDIEILEENGQPVQPMALFSSPSVPPFYSQLQRTIEAKMPNMAPPAQVIQIATSGAKAEEIKWSGLVQKSQELAAANGGKVPKPALLEWLRNEGSVRFEEVMLADSKTLSEELNRQYDAGEIDRQEYTRRYNEINDGVIPSKFSQYTLPGGENYREVVLAMPPTPVTRYNVVESRTGAIITRDLDKETADKKAASWPEPAEAIKVNKDGYADYHSNHFSDVPNYIAHMRLNERGDGLFIEELQSDRHQAGREKGYTTDELSVRREGNEYVVTSRTEERRLNAANFSNEQQALEFVKRQAIADAPFRKDWPLALFKRALRDAVAGGKKWIGWTTGETQNDRFDLSKQVDDIGVWRNGALYGYDAKKDGKTLTTQNGVSEQDLAASIGKELAAKAIADLKENGKARVYSGNDLRIGGSGMRGFYDNILPKEIGKYVKQWGGKVEKSTVDTESQKKTNRLFDTKESASQWAESNLGDHDFTVMDGPDGKFVVFDEYTYRTALAQETTPIWRIDITPEMEKGVSAGQALFSSPANQGAFDFGATGDMGTKQQRGFDFGSLPEGENAKFQTNAQKAMDSAKTETAKENIAARVAEKEGIADPKPYVKAAIGGQASFDFGTTAGFNTKSGQMGFDFAGKPVKTVTTPAETVTKPIAATESITKAQATLTFAGETQTAQGPITQAQAAKKITKSEATDILKESDALKDRPIRTYEQAKVEYLSNYSLGWKGAGDIAAYESVDAFREWATEKRRNGPAKGDAPVVKQSLTTETPTPATQPERNINARHSVPISSILTPAGAIKADALRSDADSSVWHYQGDLGQLAFDVNATFEGKNYANDYQRKTLAQVKAARADGWNASIYKAGKYGSLRIFTKGEQALTNAGADALVSGKFQAPQVNDERQGAAGTIQQQAEFASRLVEWMATLPESTVNSASAFGAKISTTKISEWLEIERGKNDVALWQTSKDQPMNPAIGRKVVAIRGTTLEGALKKAVAMAANKREGMDPAHHMGWHAWDKYAGVNEAETVNAALIAAGFKTAEASKTTPAEPEAPALHTNPVIDLDSLIEQVNAMARGETTADAIRAAWAWLKGNTTQIHAELGKLTMKQLEPLQGMRRADNKAQAVRSALHGLLTDFNPTNYYSIDPMGGNLTDKIIAAMDAKMSQWTDEMLAETRKNRAERLAAKEEANKAAAAAKEKAINNPETKEEWDRHVYIKGFRSLTEADKKEILKLKKQAAINAEVMRRGENLLTPEQLAAYDAIRGIDRKAQAQAEAERKAMVRGVKADTDTEITETKHTKTGEDLFVVKLAERVDREVYNQLNAAAKRLDGWYSSYRIGGAVPGFQFKTRANAEQFQQVVKGETVDRSEAIAERKEERKSATAQRLMDLADRMDATADGILGADRKTNTVKRAREAGYAESKANGMKAMATTIRNLAAAMESGEATHLDGVRSGTHVETLESLANRAKTDAERAVGLSYMEQERRKGEPATPEQMAAVTYPWPYMDKSSLLQMIEKGKSTPGAKLVAGRAEKIRLYDPRGSETGGYVDNAQDIETVRELAEKVNDWKGKSAWQGISWKFQQYDRVQAMGLKDLPSLRAALREFTQYRGKKAAADPLKAMERELVGMKIEGFFPTPQAVIDRMLEEAGDLEGKRVLEPSAGKGDIVDAAQREGATVDAIERHSTLRNILEAKGANLAGRDFMDVEPAPEYDAVLMNPPFEDGQDMEHVRHAYKFVKPGGTLVAIMSAGPFFRSDSKATAFRDWLESMGGVHEALPEGSFKSAFSPTGVNTHIVTIAKPADTALLSSPATYQSAFEEEKVAILSSANRGNDGHPLAPNGERSNLTEDQWATVRTKNFKRWFGDWEKYAAMDGGVWNDAENSVSKAVDENGEPLVVYHGSKEAGFDTFDPSKSNSRLRPDSVFFSDSRRTARTYSGSLDDVNFAKDEDGEPIPHRAIYAVFLNIRNPQEYNFEGANWDGSREGQFMVLDADGEQLYSEDGRGYFQDEDSAQAVADANDGAEVVAAEDSFETTNSAAMGAKRYGSDGAIIRDVMDDGGEATTYDTSNVFVVFDETQVKSAVANNGKFSSDPSILFSSPARRDTETPDLFAATTAPDAAAKLGDVKAGKMNALAAYRTLTAKRDAGKTLSGKEEQQLLDAEQALGQKLAFDMENVRGTAPQTQEPEPTGPAARFGQNSRQVQDEMSRAGEIDNRGQISLLSSPAAWPPNLYAYTYAKETSRGETKHVVKGFNEKTGAPERRVFDTFAEAKQEMDRLDDLAAPPENFKFSLASSPASEDAIQQALSKMHPIYREVFNAVNGGATPADVMAKFNITEKAVTNILNQVRSRIVIASKASAGTLEPQMQDGKFAGGRPDLAEGAKPDFVAVDQIRNESGIPDTVSMSENYAEADRRLAADYEGEFYRLETLAQTGATPDKIDIAIAKEIFRRETLSGGLNDPQRRAKVALFRLAYREMGTEQARAFQMRRDEAMTPAERNALHLAELMYEPSPSVRDRMKSADAKTKDEILKQWMEQIDAFKAEMKADGYDIDASLAAFQAHQDSVKQAEEIHSGTKAAMDEAMMKLSKREKTVIKLIRDGAKLSTVMRQTGMTKEQVMDVKHRFGMAWREAIIDAGRRFASNSLASSAPRDIYEAVMGDLGWQSDEDFDDTAPDYFEKQDAKRKDAKARERKRKQLEAPKEKPLTPEQQQAINEAFERFKNADPSTWTTLFETEAKNLTPIIGQVGFEEFKGKALRPWRDRWQTEMDGIANPSARISFEEWIAKPSTQTTAKRERELFPQPINETTGTFDTTLPNREGTLFPQPINPKTGTWSDARPYTGQGELIREEINETTGTFDINDPVAMRHIFAAASVKGASFSEKALEFWRMSILTGPQTHVVNISSNVLHAAFRMLPRRAVEATTNTILSTIGMGSQEAATFGEFSVMAKHLRQAAGLAARQALTSWRTDSRLFEEYAEAIYKQDTFSGLGQEDSPPKLGGPIGKVMRSLSFKPLTMADQFINFFTGYLDAAAQAHRIAKVKEKLQGRAYEARFKELMEPGSKAWIPASNEARIITFQSKIDGTNPRAIARLDQLAELAKRGKSMPWIGKPLSFFIPFIDTPLNIFKEAISMSPLGAVLAVVDGTRALKRRALRGDLTKAEADAEAAKLYDRARLIQDITNQTIAIASYYAISAMVEGDDDDDGLPFMTGSMEYKSTKKGERDNAYAVMPPYSFRFMGATLSYKRIEPFATAWASMADLAREINRAGGLNPGVASKWMASYKDQVGDKTFLQGLGNLIDAFQDPDRFVTRLASSITTGFIPNFVRQPIRNIDPVLRDTGPRANQNFMEALGRSVGYAIVPQSAPPRIDVWGRPIMKNRGEVVGNQATDAVLRIFDPSNLTLNPNIDPIDSWIYRYNLATADSKERIGIVPIPPRLQFTVPGQKERVNMDLSQTEHEEANIRAGKTARETLGDGWDKAPLEREIADKIITVVQQAQEAERARIKAEKMMEILK